MQSVRSVQGRRSAMMAVVALSALGSCAGPASMDFDASSETGTVIGDATVGTCVAGRASAQFIEQIAAPESMLPGGRAMVSVTFDNCSGGSWSTDGFALVPAPGTGGTFGVARAALPMDVPNGTRVTIPFEIRAPREGGTYTYSWAIAREGAETFQEYSPVGEVIVRSAANCAAEGPVARFRMQTAPGTHVGLGEPIHGTITLANCGAETWSREAGYYIASTLPADQYAWGVTRIELPNDVPFGSEVTIPIDGTTPAAPGRHGWSWVLHDDGTRVGEASPEIRITALTRGDCSGAGPASRFVTQTAPGDLDPGESANVSVTFTNCGEAVWDAGYRINAAAPATDGRWGAGNIALPAEVAPGFTIAVPFRIQAPGGSGSYPYRWVVTRGETDIDEPTPARNVTVRLNAGPCAVRPVVPGYVTSPFGYRVHPISGVWRLHTGIDLSGDTGQHIRACRSGVVTSAGWNGGYGNVITIDHGGGMSTLYAHQTGFAPGIGRGVRVDAGQHIGYVGSTGSSTAAHLHFEVRLQGTAVNPAPYL